MNNIGFIRAYLISISYLGLLGIVMYGLKGIAIAFAVAIPISGLTMMISDKCGDISARLFLGPKSNRSIRERLSGDISRARVQKMNGNYEEALLIIDNVLVLAPDLNEALFIKAQILLDGFKDKMGAKKCISRILETESEYSSLYKWAKNFDLSTTFS
jgi:hypothetical protein